MTEEKKGHIKMTMEWELNEAVMELIRLALEKWPETWSKMMPKKGEM